MKGSFSPSSHGETAEIVSNGNSERVEHRSRTHGLDQALSLMEVSGSEPGGPLSTEEESAFQSRDLR